MRCNLGRDERPESSVCVLDFTVAHHHQPGIAGCITQGETARPPGAPQVLCVCVVQPGGQFASRCEVSIGLSWARVPVPTLCIFEVCV